MDEWSVCRLCLQSNEDSLKALSDVRFEMIPFSNIYFEIVGTTFTEYPTFPGIICSSCEKNMIQAYKFRETCLETEEKLKELMNVARNPINTTPAQVPASNSKEYPKTNKESGDEKKDYNIAMEQKEQDQDQEDETKSYRYVFEVTRKQMEYLQTKTIKCSQCKRFFKGLDVFKKHTCEVLEVTEKEFPTTESVQKKIEPPKIIKCQECNLQFSSLHELNLHMDDHRKTEDIKGRLKNCRKRKSGHFKCEKCDRTFRCRNNYNLHMDRHNNVKRYPCVYCKETFSCWLKRRTHVYREHLKKSYIQCSHCGKGFTKTQDLNIHMNADHLNISYQCELCGKTYRSNANLSSHYQTHMEKVKCQICGKVLKHILSLIDHMKIHGEAQKVKCPACSREVNGNVSLEHHIRRIHPDKLYLIPSRDDLTDKQEYSSS